MSSYTGGRKAPNVSQYLASLNTIPSPTDMAVPHDGFGMDDDMNLFTNTEFLDFDIPDLGGATSPAASKRPRSSSQSLSIEGAQPFMSGDFKFPDFSIDPRFHTKAGSLNLAGQSSPATSASPTAARPTTGEKREHDFISGASPDGASTVVGGEHRVVEEAARLAAEEDKRRRNTAASARFRVKKKQREQALEKTAKEMTDRVNTLEARVQQLEMENKWLKGLIVEKQDQPDNLGEMWRQFSADAEDADGAANADKARNIEERKDGVGTVA